MSKSKRADENKYINRRLLVRIFNSFLREPDRVFVVKDFNHNIKHFRDKYLHSLISLGLVEEVETIWYTGIHHNSKRRTKGYKLK